VIEDGRPGEQEENQPGARGSDEEIGRGSGRLGERVLKRFMLQLCYGYLQIVKLHVLVTSNQ
jgi:hypothetical protein